MKKYQIYLKFLVRFLIIITIIIICGLILIVSYNAFFAHKVFPGVYLNQKPVGGQSYSEVYNFLEEQRKKITEEGINYSFQEKKINLTPLFTTIDDPDLSYSLIDFYNQKTADQIFQIGRNGNYQERILEQFKILFLKPKKITWQYSFKEKEWKKALEDNFKEFETSFFPPSIEIEDSKINIKEAISGQEFDYDYLVQLTKEKIDNFDNSDIFLELEKIESPIDLEQAMEKKDLIREIVNLESITLNYKQRFWRIRSEIYSNWLVLKERDGKIMISFDEDQYREHLEQYILSDINRESLNAKFEIQNGRVVKFQGSQDGQEVNLKETLMAIEEEINNLKTNIDLVVKVIKAEVETQDVNNQGIREIIGVGESDFRGSPPNRVHNINTGAEALNGILVAPGEEFATMGNLTPINAESGYLPELVIKGNETIPEYGGGLCQIGTTIYRAALQSGLQITQRRPHSYRVVYYEPAGMDATIYDPWPDMKFVNDTGNYILIQTKIEGTKLYFEFWGTKDGRQITVTDPVIYNITSPGPTKEIETTELEPGERKCTESAHAGADAYFDYTVDYADDRETYEERISSHYIPWPAVCLIGVEELEKEAEELKEE